MDLIAAIRERSESLADIAETDPGRSVPRYDGWTLNDLLVHVGSVHRRTTHVVRDSLQERPQREFPEDESSDLVIEWFRAGAAELVATLNDADPDAVVWGFGPTPGVRSWILRMALETAVHELDAAEAVGRDGSIAPDLAGQGIDEFGGMWGPALQTESQPLGLVATDIDRRWALVPGDGGVAFVAGAEEAAGSVAGTASDLYLWMLARVGLDRFEVTGDVTAWDALFRSLPDARR